MGSLLCIYLKCMYEVQLLMSKNLQVIHSCVLVGTPLEVSKSDY